MAPPVQAPQTPKPTRLPKRPCERCGTVYRPKQYYQRWCSTRCRTVAYWRRRIAAMEAGGPPA
jgi:predicted nucleic acid-binding Zn ribbon protein